MPKMVIEIEVDEAGECHKVTLRVGRTPLSMVTHFACKVAGDNLIMMYSQIEHPDLPGELQIILDKQEELMKPFSSYMGVL
jgi:hypothetical protein